MKHKMKTEWGGSSGMLEQVEATSMIHLQGWWEGEAQGGGRKV